MTQKFLFSFFLNNTYLVIILGMINDWASLKSSQATLFIYFLIQINLSISTHEKK